MPLTQQRRSTLVLVGQDVVRVDRDCGDGLRALESQCGHTLLNPGLDRQAQALMAAVTKIDLYGGGHYQLVAILDGDYRALAGLPST
jgi:hypothetical protein